MRTPTVLVADDHDDSRDVYATFLRHQGYEVIEAGDGRSALEAARERVPDVLVLDYHMPHMNAAEVLRQLRADARTAALPALVVTADPGQMVRMDAVAAGCRSFALKPFDPRALCLAIAGVISKASADVAAPALRPLRARTFAVLGS